MWELINLYVQNSLGKKVWKNAHANVLPGKKAEKKEKWGSITITQIINTALPRITTICQNILLFAYLSTPLNLYISNHHHFSLEEKILKFFLKKSDVWFSKKTRLFCGPTFFRISSHAKLPWINVQCSEIVFPLGYVIRTCLFFARIASRKLMNDEFDFLIIFSYGWDKGSVVRATLSFVQVFPHHFPKLIINPLRERGKPLVLRK